MNIFGSVLVSLLLRIGLSHVLAIKIVDCPLYQLHFLKTIGYRPHTSSLTAANLLSKASSSMSSPLPVAINGICWKLCKEDINCAGYVLYFNASECYAYTRNERHDKFELLTDFNLVADSSAIFFEKICMEVPSTCTEKLWPLTRIAGATLVGQGYRNVTRLIARSECIQMCLKESDFKCRSVAFTVSRRNNRERNDPNYPPSEKEELGQCVLSSEDKNSQPESFRAAEEDFEYFENECAKEAEFCAFEHYENSAFIYPEMEYHAVDRKECEWNCLSSKNFTCHGYTYVDWKYMNPSKCVLHSEDLLSLGPRAIQFNQGYIYMKRVKCLNVTVECTPDQMMVRFSPQREFNGRMYIRGRSERCVVLGDGEQPVQLNLPIGSEFQEQKCGVTRAYQFASGVNRTLIQATVVIQSSRQVQTQSDRLIRAGCILNMDFEPDFYLPNDLDMTSTVNVNQLDSSNRGSKTFHSTSGAPLPLVSMHMINLEEFKETNDVKLGQNLEFRIVMVPADTIYDIQAVNLTARTGDGSKAILLIDDRGCPTDPKIFPGLQKEISSSGRVLFTRFNAFKFVDTSRVSFEATVRFCFLHCPEISCGGKIRTIAFGRRRRRRDVVEQATIVNTERTAGGATVYYESTTTDWPPTTTEIPTTTTDLSPIFFPGPTIMSQLLPETRFAYNTSGASQEVRPVELNLREDDRMIVSDDFSYLQKVFSEYTVEDEGVVIPLDRKNISRTSRLLRKSLAVPLKFELNVRGPDSGDVTDSLVYGDNNRILVAGISLDDDDDHIIKISPPLLAAILIFWVIFQVLLIVVCCALIKRYKNYDEFAYDRSSLERIHSAFMADSLDRRVRWADHPENVHI